MLSRVELRDIIAGPHFTSVHLLSLERVPELDTGDVWGCLHLLALAHAPLPPGHLDSTVLSQSRQSLSHLISQKLPVDAGLLWRPPGEFYRVWAENIQTLKVNNSLIDNQLICMKQRGCGYYGKCTITIKSMHTYLLFKQMKLWIYKKKKDLIGLIS